MRRTLAADEAELAVDVAFLVADADSLKLVWK